MVWRILTALFLVLGGSSASILELNGTLLRSIPPLYALDEWSECQAPGDVYCIVDAKLVSTDHSPILSFLQYWNEKKYGVRRKVTELREHGRGTGGGPAKKWSLNPMEERIFAVLGRESIIGNTSVQVPLHEYSKQSLKHYNRTLIHRGVCVSRCGPEQPDAWHSAAQRCLNTSLHKYGLEAEIQSVSWCSTADVPYRTSAWSARALCVVSTLLAALAVLSTALHALQTRVGKTDGNKFLLAFSLKKNWDILTYDRTKPRSDDRMKDVACVEGIRVLGMQCVIFSHVIFIYIYSYVDNPEYVEKMYDQFGWKVVLNSPLWLQAFFSISGFLTAYSVLISSSTNPITLFKCFMSVVSRWIRLTPVSVFALWFTIAWFPRLGRGPQWSWLVEREASDCSERWWYHALYVHNHLPTGKFCMGHTWYLAADMQLHIFGILLMFLLMKFRRAVPLVLAALLTGSMLAAGLTSHVYSLLPIITAQSPEVLRTMFLGSGTLTQLYLPAWMNLPGYVGGLATAFLLHYAQHQGLKLNQKKWFNILFHLALTLGGCVVACGAIFLGDHQPPLWAAALYAALDRALVAVCFNVFLLGCLTQCPSGLRRLLGWRGWHAAGRLTFCVFVVHFIVLRLTLAANTHLGHANILSLISLLVTSSVLSYAASIPLCLLVELPALQLWKALTGEGAARPRAAAAPAPAPAPAAPQPASSSDMKPLDLLANVTRRHHV